MFLLIFNPSMVSIRAVSSFFSAVCFRYSTSILAHCLSHCKGTIFCWILFDFPCLLVALPFLNQLSEARKVEQEDAYLKIYYFRESAVCRLPNLSLLKDKPPEKEINNVCNWLSN